MLRQLPDNKLNLGLQYKIKESLGSGTYGSVSKIALIFPIILEKDMTPEMRNIGEFVKKHEWTVKIVSDASYSCNEREPYILARFQPTLSLFKINNDEHAWITKYIPGKPLNANNCADLDFYQSLQLVTQAVIALNLHHRKGVMHGDVKSLNILAIINNAKQTDVAFVDYGFSVQIPFQDESNNSKQENIQIKKIRYDVSDDLIDFHEVPNPRHFPLEVVKGKWGLKTDIYMMAKVIKDFLVTKPWPKTVPNVEVFYNKFIMRMRSQNYHDRPNSDEVVKFFNTLMLFYKMHQTSSPDISLKNEYAAKLALLTDRDIAKELDVDFLVKEIDLGILNKFTELNVENLINKQVISTLLTDKNLQDELKQKLNNDSKFMQKVLSEFTNQLSSSQIFNAIKIISQESRKIDLSFLANLSGTIKECRETATDALVYLLSQTKTMDEVNNIAQQLTQLTNAKKIQYLDQRQGWLKFSIHNHKWNDQKVSGTWVELMRLIENRKKYLARTSADKQAVRARQSSRIA